MNYFWLFTMAWRDSRRNRSRLLLFMSSIVLGIAALVAINSFGDSMQRDIEGEAKKLLGADLVVESRFPFSEKVQQRLDSLAERQSEEVSFASMVLFPKNDGSRLVQVRALQGDFPTTVPSKPIRPRPEAPFSNNNRPGRQHPDASVRCYRGRLPQSGQQYLCLIRRHQQGAGAARYCATVPRQSNIPLSELEASGLLQRGSRVN